MVCTLGQVLVDVNGFEPAREALVVEDIRAARRNPPSLSLARLAVVVSLAVLKADGKKLVEVQEKLLEALGSQRRSPFQAMEQHAFVLS